MKVHSVNIIAALTYAIRAKQEEEYLKGSTSDSALLAGWKRTREALKRGEALDIQRGGESD